MRKSNILSAAACVLIAGCATAGLAQATAQGAAKSKAKAPVVAAKAAVPPPVTCKVVATPTAHGVRIEAVVTSRKALAGRYDLAIRRDGAYGASEIVQGGDFTAKGGEALTLASSELGSDGAGRLKASLVIRDKPGAVCRHDVR